MAVLSTRVELEGFKEPPGSGDLLIHAVPSPVTMKLACPLDDQQLMTFCEANEEFDIECDADGSIKVMSPAKAQTSRLNQLLNLELALWARQNGGTVFGPDLGIRFPDQTMRGPDCAWLFASKWDGLSLEDQENFLHFCPEFIAELRSKIDRASAIEAKMEFWMCRGAELGWMIDPQRKLAMIYRPGQEAEVLLRPQWLDGDGPLAEFRLQMEPFWA